MLPIELKCHFIIKKQPARAVLRNGCSVLPGRAANIHSRYLQSLFTVPAVLQTLHEKPDNPIQIYSDC